MQGNPRKNTDLGSRGSGVIFTVNIIERLAQKLRRSILLHSGLITFRFNFGKPGRPHFSWFSDLVDVSMTPKTNYFLFLEAPNDFKTNKKNTKWFSENTILGNLEILDIDNLENCGKGGGRNIPKTHLKSLQNIEYESNIYQQTWN